MTKNITSNRIPIVLDGGVIQWPPEQITELANLTDEQVLRAASLYATRMRSLGVEECPECFQFGEHGCTAKN